MEKLNFKEYIEDTTKKYDNTVIISYYKDDEEIKSTYEYVRVLKIYDDCINIDNQTIKLDNIKDMNIKINGNVEKIIVESEKSMVDFEKCEIGSIETKKLDCGDLSNIGYIIVENSINCGDINNVQDLRTENGNISCGDIKAEKISSKSISCGDIDADKINISGSGISLSCCDIASSLSIDGDVDIRCSDVGGSVNIEGSGNIKCGDIGGNLTTSTDGDISCGDIFGDMINKK